MNDYTITNFINEQLVDVSQDLRDTQIEIQMYSQLQIILYCMYFSSWIQFEIWLNASFNDVSDNINLQFMAFQEAKYNYELCEYYSFYLHEIVYSLENLIKLEKITKEDYAELMLIKEDGYNMNEFTTFMYRNLKRFERLFEIYSNEEK